MKLASLKEGGRDGTLIVVNDLLTQYVRVDGIIATLQEALENWREISPELDQTYAMLCAGEARDAEALDLASVSSPLPRAYQWLDASAYLPHIERIRRSRNMPVPDDVATNPLMYQGAADTLLGPYDAIPVSDTGFGIDFEAEVAVVTDDVPMGVSVEDATAHIKLVMLVNDMSLRNLAMGEINKHLGFIQAKTFTAFSPVAITPDTLGDAWREGKLHLPLSTHYNGALFGHPNAGEDMLFSFPQLIAHAARTRPLSAGTIIGSGTVSNHDPARGVCCILERRTLEQLETGNSITPFMQYGDTVRIEMMDAQERSLFGAIEQHVVPYSSSSV